MDEYQLRLEALTAAIKIAPSDMLVESSAIIADARKFYDFLIGDSSGGVTVELESLEEAMARINAFYAQVAERHVSIYKTTD